jgi:hypothetical protein
MHNYDGQEMSPEKIFFQGPVFYTIKQCDSFWQRCYHWPACGGSDSFEKAEWWSQPPSPSACPISHTATWPVAGLRENLVIAFPMTSYYGEHHELHHQSKQSRLDRQCSPDT